MSNHIRNYLLFFLTGVVITLIPTMLYIGTLKKESVIPYKFMPNAMAERKPIYMQVFKTQEEVDAIKKTGVYLSEDAEIGAGVTISTTGLDMYLKRQLDGSDAHLKNIGSQMQMKIDFKGYTYIPNAIFTVDPAPVQVIKNEETVKIAQNDPTLTYKQYLEVGGVIQCPQSIPCYAISRSDTNDRLIIKPLTISKPEEEQKK